MLQTSKNPELSRLFCPFFDPKTTSHGNVVLFSTWYRFFGYVPKIMQNIRVENKLLVKSMFSSVM